MKSIVYGVMAQPGAILKKSGRVHAVKGYVFTCIYIYRYIDLELCSLYVELCRWGRGLGPPLISRSVPKWAQEPSPNPWRLRRIM